MKFKLGAKVKIKNSILFNGVYKINRINHIDEYYQLEGEDVDTSYKFIEEMLELYEEEFVPEIFTIVNCNEAKKYIGKTMEFCYNHQYHRNIWFTKKLIHVNNTTNEIFTGINDDLTSNGFHIVRTCKETFKKDNTELFNALEKSILQWEIMISTGKTKEEVYEFLGGTSNVFHCFLCDYTGYSSDKNKCENCIKWNDDNDNCFSNSSSVYSKWNDNESKENAINVLNFLVETRNKMRRAK